MRYLHREFSVYSPDTDEYRDNWERTFGKKVEKFPCIRCDDWLPAEDFGPGGIESGVCKQCENE